MRHSREKISSCISAAFFVMALFAGSALADDAPSWMRQAMLSPVPSYDRSVPGVVLLDDQQTILNAGKLTTVENYAVKLLSRDGRSLAVARAFYLVSSGRVKDLKAWLIRPDGTVKVYDKKFVLDMIADPDDVYNEGRIKLIDASSDADTGYVFGFTVESEETPLFYQDSWSFQRRLPTLASRYSLVLPSGWSAASLTFNAAEIKPQAFGNTYTWEMRDLPDIPAEPMSQSVANRSPRIVVNYGPGDAASADRSFATWADVSRWATQMHEPQVVVDDAIAAKARDLTAGAETELDKIRAIGKYVQNLQYISIDIGVGYGNGYKPRSSTLVLGRGYGDCKDKANLMRALLKSLRIEAYPVAIYAGDPTFVRAQFPSPIQFNHCIIAIRVAAGTDAGTVIVSEKLGRLMIFDATDPYTPVGSLPSSLQGSFGMIAAGDNGGLARMPVMTADSDMLERTIEASVSAAGAVEGTISEKASGQIASGFRREARELSASDFRKTLEGWLTRGATGARLMEVKSTDRFADSAFDLYLTFTAPNYGQLMQGKLLIFKPVIVGRRQDLYLTEPARKSPVETDSSSMKETTTFSLPEGFIVDETPTAVSLETEFGKYSAGYEVKNNKLVFMRSLTMKRSLIPVDKYDSIRTFFSKMRDSEQSPVVLIKK